MLRRLNANVLVAKTILNQYSSGISGQYPIKLSSAVASQERPSGLYLFAPATFPIRVFPAPGWQAVQARQAPDSRKSEYVAISEFQTLFAVSYYFHTSFKLVSNSSFKLAVKGELQLFRAQELEIWNLYRYWLFKFHSRKNAVPPEQRV